MMKAIIDRLSFADGSQILLRIEARPGNAENDLASQAYYVYLVRAIGEAAARLNADRRQETSDR